MRSGIPLALASSALFGLSTPIAKLLLGTVDPWLLAGLLYLGSGAGTSRSCTRTRTTPTSTRLLSPDLYLSLRGRARKSIQVAHK